MEKVRYIGGQVKRRVVDNPRKNKFSKDQKATKAICFRNELIDYLVWFKNSYFSLIYKIGLFANDKRVVYICLFILPIAIFIYYPSRTDDYDIFYHLRFGKYFIDNMTFNLDHSIFSWTSADPNWRYGIWIGSTIIYLSYVIFSTYGFFLLQWGIFICIFLLYYNFIKACDERLDILHIVNLFFVYVALNLTAIYIKPEMFTNLYFAISVYIYFKTKYLGNSLFWLYPIIFFFWVNTHGGYLMGIAFITLVLIGESINYLLKNEALSLDSLKSLFISVFLSYIAIAFNPYGINYHVEIIKTIISEEYMSVATQVYAWTSMWRYLFPGEEMPFRFFYTSWLMVIMFMSWFFLSFYLYLKKRYFDIAIILLMFFMLYQGMKAARVTLFLPILWLFAFLFVIKRFRYTVIKEKIIPYAIIVFLISVILVLRVSIIYLDDWSWFGSNIMRDSPQKEADFLKNNKLSNRFFNDYLIGGYLIWSLYPDYKVFIDPRYGPYWREVGPDYFNLTRNLNVDNLNKMINKYRFNAAIISLREMPLIATFLQFSDWKLLFFDKSAAIIVHQSIIKDLPAEVLQLDISPSRFKHVTNPTILTNVFQFYNSLSSIYSKHIIEIYKNNVKDFYIAKYHQLAQMQNMLDQRINIEKRLQVDR